jgi:dethiobiotin synthetase
VPETGAGLACVNATTRPPIVFITGTDTGVGKTLLTALLLLHLRRHGCRALGMKPFCSGDRADVRLLHGVQGGELSVEEVNPFYFEEPLAPLAAARMRHLSIPLQEVLRRISHLAGRCQRLLIEGAGGILVPLGERYSVADLISKLNCEVIVVSANRLGTINHTLLTVRALQDTGITALKVVLMGQRQPDQSSDSNHPILAELLGRVPVFSVGFLGREVMGIKAIQATEKKVEKILAQILA